RQRVQPRLNSRSRSPTQEAQAMPGKSRASLLGVTLLFAAAGVCLWAADKATPQEKRERLAKAFREGNYKAAYDGLRPLALDPSPDPKTVGDDLDLAISALVNLGRVEEVDEFREAVVAAHAKNWRLLQAAALSLRRVDPYGYIVAGKFSRGWKRGGGRWVNT